MATNFSKAFCMTALFVAIIVNSGCTKIPLSSFAESLHGIEVVLPPNAPRIKSDFNDLRDINGNMRGHRHKGIDIVASVGHPVLAPASGRIKKLDRTKDGLILEIWYSVGYDTIITSYLHLNSVSVEIGNFVKRGQQIATVGKTGSTSGGVPHLHFSVGGGRNNPHKYWIGGPGKIVCFEPGKKYKSKGRNMFTYPVKCDQEN